MVIYKAEIFFPGIKSFLLFLYSREIKRFCSRSRMCDQRPRFRSYAVEQHRPSYRYNEEVRIGAVLPEEGVTYYDVPPEYGVRDYRYTVVNDRTVLVDPRTHRIVEVVE